MDKVYKVCPSCTEAFEPILQFCPKCGIELPDGTHSPRENSDAFSRGITPEATEVGGLSLALIEEKNAKEKNLLLLGALVVVSLFSVSFFVYSIFNYSLGVVEIDTGNLVAFVPELEPDQAIEEKPEEEEESNRKSGGGGGGGKDQDTEASKGRLADQMKNPPNPPTPMDQVTNPELRMEMATEGNNSNPRTKEKIGVLGGLSDESSSGTGSGGGTGTGDGTGQGTGKGRGRGSGSGSGSGSGTGDGDGDGDGPPRIKSGPTTNVRILSKPRASYTDSARQQGIQGKVVLRVTFQSNGQIGAISAVSGLPAGLTEKAIAAARGISFEPAMRNGVPYSVTRTIEYSFTIY